MTLEQALERIADLESEVRELRGAAGYGDEVKLKKMVGSTPMETRVLLLFMSRRELARGSIVSALYSGRANGGPEFADKIVDLCIHRLRKKLSAFGAKIQTVWGYGYSISKEDQELLRALAADRCNE